MENYRLSEPNEKQREAAVRIAYEALSEIATNYGSGYPGDAPAEVNDLAYHNLQHSVQVRRSAGQLAQVYGLSSYDRQLTEMIAASHDVTHESTADASAELRSATWLVRRMQVAGFGDEDLEIACLAIDGTTPLIDVNGNFAGQRYSHLSFPSERAEIIARCVAGADMGSAYTNYGPTVAHELFKEYAGIGTHEHPKTLKGLEEFQAGQVTFLENLQPVYPGIDQLLGGLKEQGIQHHAMLLQELQSGHVMTWEDVIRLDAEYAEQWKLS